MNSTESNIELQELSVKINTKIFQQLLADVLIVYAKTKDASSNFTLGDIENKVFFQKKIIILEKVLGIITSQIRKLDYEFQGTLTKGLRDSKINEFDAHAPSAEYFIRILLKDHHQIIEYIRQCLKDNPNTLNFQDSLNSITEILQLHVEMTWMLRDLLISINYSE